MPRSATSDSILDRERARRLDRDRLEMLMALGGGSYPGPGAVSANAKTTASIGKQGEKTAGPAGDALKMAEQEAAKRLKQAIDKPAWPAALSSFTVVGIVPEGFVGFLVELGYWIASFLGIRGTVPVPVYQKLLIIVLGFFYLFLAILAVPLTALAICTSPVGAVFCGVYFGKEFVSQIIGT